jgi:hypothetical protein
MLESPLCHLSSSLLIEADMNDPEALKVYWDLLLFREHSFLTELFFDDPSLWKQGVLCTAAKSLGLEYEYRLSIQQAKISRPAPVQGFGWQPRMNTTYEYFHGSESILQDTAMSQHTRSEASQIPLGEELADGSCLYHGDGDCAPSYLSSFANASATSSISEYSGAGSYFSPPSPQSLPWTGGFQADPSSTTKTMSGIIKKALVSIDQKTHKCTVCDKRFTRLSSLRTHSYSHTDEKRMTLIVHI